MKTLLLPILCALMFAGCATTPSNEAVSGVIVRKQHDQPIENCYYTPGGLACVPTPDTYWLIVRDASGKEHNVIMRHDVEIEQWHLLEVGDAWPQR